MSNIPQLNIQQHWLMAYQQTLTGQIRQERLPHAILCAGAVGSGETVLADWIVRTVSCQQPMIDSDNIAQPCGECKHCLLMSSNTYPDLKVIDEDGATISVDRLREVTHFLEMKAQIGAHKSVLLVNAESMSIAASNALLKTLEEPALGNILVLTTHNTEHLLPTIISRCQLIDIRPNIQRAMQLTTGKIDPYANVSYLPEINTPSLHQTYRHFTDNFLGMMLNQVAWQDFEQVFISQERSLIWVERAISLLIRYYHGVDISQSLDLNLAQQVKSKISIDSLNQIFKLILATNFQLKATPQLNAALAKQQCAVLLFNNIANVESVHG